MSENDTPMTRTLMQTLAAPGGASEGWRADLICDVKGTPKNLHANYVAFFRWHSAWRDCIRFDARAQAVTIWGRPAICPEGARVTDAVLSKIAVWMATESGSRIEATMSAIQEALYAVAHDHEYDPVVTYLDSLDWDGVPRLDRWLSRYLCVAETDYSSAVGAMWLMSAVARARKPGCDVHTCLLLIGKQGHRKSAALRAITGAPWFRDDLPPLGTEDAKLGVCGPWVVELAELASVRRAADVEAVKAFFSTPVDTFRRKYAREESSVPRRCVFAASTNADHPLTDDTGNRRFWPVRIQGRIDTQAIERDRDQLWAEADVRFQAGERFWFEDEEQARRAQEDARAPDPYLESVEAALPVLVKAAQHAGQVRDGCAYVLVKDVARAVGARDGSTGDAMRMARCLKDLGWTSTIEGKRRVRVWLEPR